MFRFFRVSLKISSEILIFSGIDYICEVPNSTYIKKPKFPKKFSNFLEKNETLRYRQLASRGYAKDPSTFYSFNKMLYSQEVLHGFEHDFKSDLVASDRGQTRITSDVSIPTVSPPPTMFSGSGDLRSEVCADLNSKPPPPCFEIQNYKGGLTVSEYP